MTGKKDLAGEEGKKKVLVSYWSWTFGSEGQPKRRKVPGVGREVPWITYEGGLLHKKGRSSTTKNGKINGLLLSTKKRGKEDSQWKITKPR